MFSVIFEVRPRPEQWDAYLANVQALQPELAALDGFLNNIRYKSLTRDGWILSLSDWRDEKAVVRWRTTEQHHVVQGLGRAEILADYHLRVGPIIQDTRLPKGQSLAEQRQDETQVGEAAYLTLIDAARPAEWAQTNNPADCSQFLGLDPYAYGLVQWDVFDAVFQPGELILMMTWKRREDAEQYERLATLPDGSRLRHIRVVRDYGMFDRREAPQFYPPAPGAPS
ncbi:MAG: antibiotic biosynthesis monooxygenase [Caulobacterales bacterium]|nr:antibiotic biosynthesis monooxygenase [Caulobacterales bacterium]